MKSYHIFKTLLFVLVTSGVLAQSNYVGLYHSDHQGENVYHAEGIFKYFIQSDNELRFGNSEKAVLILDNAIAENPFFAESYLKRSQLMARLGRLEESQNDLQTAQRLNPFLGKLLGKNNRLGKLELLAFDYQSFDDNYSHLLSDVHVDLLEETIQYKLEGDLNNALINLEQVLQTNDNQHAFLYGFRGNIYLLMRNYPQAIMDYEKAIQLAQNPAKYYFNRGLARLFSYNRSSACADIEMSKQLGFEEGEEKLKYFCKY